MTIPAAALALASLAGCGGGGSSNTGVNTANLPTAVAADIQRSAAVDPAVVTANNGFGFSLLQQLDSGAATSNTLLSPASVSLALEMTYTGSAGTTQTAMAQALQLNGMSPSTVNTDNAALEASLVSPDPAVTLTIANGLWTRANAVLPAFITANTTYYGAQLGDVAGAPANVNAWVSSASHGTITQLLPPGDYSLSVAILANVIYFAGQWTNEFNTNLTQSANFTTASGTTVSVPLMHQTGTYAYLKGSGFQAIKLPYGTGRLAMVVVLPDAGTDWSTFLASLSASNFNAWTSQMTSQYGSVALPKFTLQGGATLNSDLSALGMGVAFDPSSANFSGIGSGLYIQAVYHKVYIKVNEEGTVAAGATGVVVGTAVESPSFAMTIDHPFLCAIQDTKTGEILFLCAIADPSQTG
jgi:serpin B